MKKYLLSILVALILFNVIGFTHNYQNSLQPLIAFAEDPADGVDPADVPPAADVDATTADAEPAAGTGATDTGEAASATENLTDTGRTAMLQLQAFFSVILLFLNYLIWPLLIMIGVLMDNSLIFGGAMEDKLLQIWSQVRNIVNLLFVVILIGVALYNVSGLGGDDGDYAIKTILPKFILALVLVNFSFLGAKLILDAANVVTTAVFALPNAVEEGVEFVNEDEIAQDICVTAKMSGTMEDICTGAGEFSEDAKEFFRNLNGNNIAFVMAVNLGQIQKGLEVSEVLRENPNLVNLTVNILFSLVMYLIYAASFIALFFVLLVRIGVLWIIIAFSPLIALQLVVPNLISGAGGGGVDLKEKFITHAIAPIKIGAGMTIGYIMLDTFHRTGVAAQGLAWGNDFANVFSSANTLQDLIIAIAAVAIVFKVTFDAANETAAKSITTGIENFLLGIGSNLSKVPLIIPWVPVSNELDVPGEDGSVDGRLSLGQLTSGISGGLDNIIRQGTQYNRSGGIENMEQLRNHLRGNGQPSNNLQAMRYLASDSNSSRLLRTENQVSTIASTLRTTEARGQIPSTKRRNYDEVMAILGADEHANKTFQQLWDQNPNNFQRKFIALVGNGLDPTTLGATSTATTTPTAAPTAAPTATTTPPQPGDPPPPNPSQGQQSQQGQVDEG